MSRTGQLVVALAALVAGVWLVWPQPEGPPPEPPPTSTPTSNPTLPLSVEYDGCHYVRLPPGTRDHECVYQVDRPVRLWVNHAGAAEANILVDGASVTAEPYEVEHEPGAGYRVSLPAGAQWLSVQSIGGAQWALRLRDADEVTAEARALRKDLRDRAIAVQKALRDGEPVLPESQTVIRDALMAGLLSDAIQFAAGTSFYALTRLERPLAAQRLLDAMLGPAHDYPLGRAILSIYLARILRVRGRRLDAIVLARRGSRTALHLDNVPTQIDGFAEYSLLLGHLGYTEAAAYWGDHTLALARETKSNQLVALLEAAATVGLDLADAGHHERAPHHILRELLGRVGSDSPKPSAPVEARTLLLLAELAMLETDPRSALEYLKRIRLEHLRQRHHIQFRSLEVETQVALGADAPVLVRGLAQLEELLPTAMELTARWRATVAQGLALEALGRDHDAELAYTRSEGLLDSMLPLAALGIGGQALAARHDHGTQRLLMLLLRGPTPRRQEALCVARRAQARLARLSSLARRLDRSVEESLGSQLEHYTTALTDYEALLQDAAGRPQDQLQRAKQDALRHEQELQRMALTILSADGTYEAPPTCEDLRPRKPTELLLSLVPIESDLLVLAAHDGGMTHYRVTHEADPSVLSKSLFEPLAGPLRRATNVRVLATGKARQIAVHALPHEGQPLGLGHSVVYGLDLGTIGRPRDAPEARHAVVLRDGEVPAASDAAKTATRGLGALDLRVHSFSTGDDPAEQVRQHLVDAAFFFYVGHAYFGAQTRGSTQGVLDLTEREGAERWPPYPGGAATEPSYLPLGPMARLTVADVAMMPDPPSVVVLMGCATGVTDERVVYGGQSLAISYLGAGTRVAIASTRPVEETEAFLVNEGLAEHLGAAVTDDPGRWMQHALLWARDHGLQETSIADYRVYVP